MANAFKWKVRIGQQRNRKYAKKIAVQILERKMTVSEMKKLTE